MNNSQEVATTIKSLAKKKKITIKQMLSECELSINTLSSMQSGGYYPRVEALAKIADYLDCSVDYLLGRTDIPEINKPSEDVRIFKIAARDGEKEIELTAAQRAEIARIVESSKNDDNSDLF